MTWRQRNPPGNRWFNVVYPIVDPMIWDGFLPFLGGLSEFAGPSTIWLSHGFSEVYTN